jgi:hypothetical protein
MALHDDDHRSLFRAPPATDATDGPDTAFDGSDEAMRQLRHPFDVPPAVRPDETTDDSGDQKRPRRR